MFYSLVKSYKYYNASYQTLKDGGAGGVGAGVASDYPRLYITIASRVVGLVAFVQFLGVIL